MADRITLSVTVRDMTRAPFAAIEGRLRRLHRLMAGNQQAGWFRGLDERLGRVHRRLDAMAASGGRLSSMWSAMGRSVGRLRTHLSSLDAHLRSSSSRTVPRMMAAVRGMTRAVEVAGRAFSGFWQLMSQNPRVGAIVVAVYQALIGLAPVLAGLLTVTLGGAFTALGAYALRGSKQVKDAFNELKKSASSTLTQAAAPMQDFLVMGIQRLSTGIKDLRPALSAAFAATGPLIQPLVDSLLAFVNRAMPGFVAALSSAKPVMDGFTNMMGSLGEGIGELFAAFTSGSGASDLGNWLSTFGEGIREVLGAIGTLFASIASNDEMLSHMGNTLKTVSLVLETLGPVFKIVSLAMIPLQFVLEKITHAWERFLEVMHGGRMDYDDWMGMGIPKNIIGAWGNILGIAEKSMDQGAVSAAAYAAGQQQIANASSVAAGALATMNAEILKQAQAEQSALGGKIAFEGALRQADQAFKNYKGTLRMVNGELDVHSKADQQVGQALLNIAQQTTQYRSNLDTAKASQEKMNSVLLEGRNRLREYAIEKGNMSKKDAEALVNQLLPLTKGPEMKIQANIDDIKRKIAEAKEKLKSLPSSKQAKVRADIADLQRKLTIAKAALDAIRSKTVTVGVGVYTTEYRKVVASGGNNSPHGPYADQYRAAGGYISGPGSGTSDDIPAMLSNGEFVINAKATKRNRRLLEGINNGTLQGFAKGGMSDSMRRARSESNSLLTRSYFGLIAGYKYNETQNDLGKPDTLGSLVSALNGWRSRIKAATSGNTEARLLSSLTKYGKSLIANEKKLAKVNTALDKAKTKLTDLKDKAAQLSSSVSTGLISGANITGAAGGEDRVTRGQVIGGLTANRDKVQAFADALAKLKKMGLNGQSLADIAQAGVDGGGLETAEALIGSSSSEIKTINSLQSQIGKYAKAAGATAADAMYGAGIKAAEGMVKGLQKQQDKLEKVMMSAANAFAKQVKKALGIKGKANGGPVGAASGGPRSAWTLVGEQGAELVRLPYGSSVKPNGKTRQMMGGMGGGGTVIVHQTIELDGKVLARQLMNPLSGEIRRINGGDVQAALGQKGRG